MRCEVRKHVQWPASARSAVIGRHQKVCKGAGDVRIEVRKTQLRVARGRLHRSGQQAQQGLVAEEQATVHMLLRPQLAQRWLRMVRARRRCDVPGGSCLRARS